MSGGLYTKLCLLACVIWFSNLWYGRVTSLALAAHLSCVLDFDSQYYLEFNSNCSFHDIVAEASLSDAILLNDGMNIKYVLSVQIGLVWNFNCVNFASTLVPLLVWKGLKLSNSSTP